MSRTLVIRVRAGSASLVFWSILDVGMDTFFILLSVLVVQKWNCSSFQCSEMIGAKGKHRLTNVNLFDVGNCKEKTFIELIMIL